MFKIITTLTMFLLGLLAQAQVTETRTITPFSKIEITDGVALVFTQSDEIGLSAEASDALGLTSITTEVTGNVLKIGSKGNMNEPGKVYVSAHGITAISARKHSTITLANTLESKNISIALASGSVFSGSIKAQDISLKAKSGAVMNVFATSATLTGNFKSKAKVNLSGISEMAEINTNTAALCYARNFRSGKVAVNVGDYSSVMINANGYLNIHVAETGKVTYFGSPEKVTMQEDATAFVTNTN